MSGARRKGIAAQVAARVGREIAAAPVSRRAAQLESVSIPLLYSYEKRGARKTTSMVLGLFKWTRTPAAWRTRILWFLSFSGGDADRLVEVDG